MRESINLLGMRQETAQQVNSLANPLEQSTSGLLAT